MEEGKMMSFRSIVAFKSTLEKEIEGLKQRAEEYSETIGEKLRTNAANSESDLSDLREKMSEPADPKKKKPVKKRDQKGSWHNFGGVYIYDGVGLRGELEICFRALEEVKTRIGKLEKIKESIDGLVSRGIKNELGCTAFLNRDLLLNMAFTKAASPLARFTYKSTFRVEAERFNEIRI